MWSLISSDEQTPELQVSCTCGGCCKSIDVKHDDGKVVIYISGAPFCFYSSYVSDSLICCVRELFLVLGRDSVVSCWEEDVTS